MESPVKAGMGTVENFTFENIGIAFGILSLGGTEPEVHLGGHLPPNCNVRFKKYHCNTRVNYVVGNQPHHSDHIGYTGPYSSRLQS